MRRYVCECGRTFTNGQQLGGHISRNGHNYQVIDDSYGGGWGGLGGMGGYGGYDDDPFDYDDGPLFLPTMGGLGGLGGLGGAWPGYPIYLIQQPAALQQPSVEQRLQEEREREREREREKERQREKERAEQEAKRQKELEAKATDEKARTAALAKEQQQLEQDRARAQAARASALAAVREAHSSELDAVSEELDDARAALVDGLCALMDRDGLAAANARRESRNRREAERAAERLARAGLEQRYRAMTAEAEGQARSAREAHEARKSEQRAQIAALLALAGQLEAARGQRRAASEAAAAQQLRASREAGQAAAASLAAVTEAHGAALRARGGAHEAAAAALVEESRGRREAERAKAAAERQRLQEQYRGMAAALAEGRAAQAAQEVAALERELEALQRERRDKGAARHAALCGLRPSTEVAREHAEPEGHEAALEGVRARGAEEERRAREQSEARRADSRAAAAEERRRLEEQHAVLMQALGARGTTAATDYLESALGDLIRDIRDEAKVVQHSVDIAVAASPLNAERGPRERLRELNSAVAQHEAPEAIRGKAVALRPDCERLLSPVAARGAVGNIDELVAAVDAGKSAEEIERIAHELVINCGDSTSATIRAIVQCARERDVVGLRRAVQQARQDLSSAAQSIARAIVSEASQPQSPPSPPEKQVQPAGSPKKAPGPAQAPSPKSVPTVSPKPLGHAQEPSTSPVGSGPQAITGGMEKLSINSNRPAEAVIGPVITVVRRLGAGPLLKSLESLRDTVDGDGAGPAVRKDGAQVAAGVEDLCTSLQAAVGACKDVKTGARISAALTGLRSFGGVLSFRCRSKTTTAETLLPEIASLGGLLKDCLRSVETAKKVGMLSADFAL
eukprot:m51a1_g14794 hypothetical protein (863) ;mRNA; f:515272-517860